MLLIVGVADSSLSLDKSSSFATRFGGGTGVLGLMYAPDPRAKTLSDPAGECT